MILSPLSQDQIVQAEREIFRTYGHRVSVAAKSKTLIKYGRNANVGTSRATIQQFQGSELHESYVSSNIIDRIVTDDNTYAGSVYVEGHTISGNDLTFVTQQVTLNGQTPVALTTPLARANRIYGLSDPMSSGKKIYVFEDSATTSGVPDDSTKTHVLIEEGFNKTQKCSTSISKDDYWLLTLFYGGVLEKASRAIDIRLEVRPVGGVFSVESEKSATSDGNANFDLAAPPIFIVPPNCDVRCTTSSSGVSTEVYAGIGGYLASIIS